MQKILVILLILLSSCYKFPDSIGEYNEISIIVSSEDRELIYPYMMNFLDDYINTPTIEKEYKITWLYPEDFFKHKLKNNIFIISLDVPKDSTIDLLYNKFNSNNNYDKNKLFAIEDVYAKNQIIMLLKAFDSIEFNKILNNNITWIEENFVENINSKIHYNYLANNNMNNDIQKIILNKYNIELSIDDNYQIIQNNDNFFWIGRGYPYRWLMLFKSNNLNKNEYWDNFKKSIYEYTNNNVYISDVYKNISDKKITGIYEHNLSDTGGPFFCYIFENDINNEVTFISGFVNNPGKNKHYLYKQLELIVENLK